MSALIPATVALGMSVRAANVLVVEGWTFESRRDLADRATVVVAFDLAERAPEDVARSAQEAVRSLVEIAPAPASAGRPIPVRCLG